MNNYIDLEKVSNSIETLSTMENLVNYVDLADNFVELEKIFRKINFEHDNCLKYKDSLEIVYNDIETVRRKVNELIDALKRTSNAYNGVEFMTRKDLKALAEIYQSTPASEKLQKQIDEYNTNQKKIYAASLVQIGKNEKTITQTSLNNKGPIDTTPIGVAIGVTGIIGSLAAVAVNEKNRQVKKRRKVKVKYPTKSNVQPQINNNYVVQVYKADKNNSKELDENDEYFHLSNQEESNSYQAARMERESDRFYGNQLSDIIPNQPDLTLDDEEDDDDFDDFDE